MKVVKCLVTSFINYSVTRGRDPPALVNTMCKSFQNVRNYDITNMCYGSNYCHVSPWKPSGMLNKSCVNIYQNPAVTVDIMKTSPQVVFAVVCYRTLRQPPNLLLLALAVTDLCVSVVVMPGNN